MGILEENYHKFKYANHIGKDELSNLLETNIKMYLDWAFLSIGGWTNVVSGGLSGAYGGDFSRLYPVKDYSYTDGRVWRGARKDWVYESGVDYVAATGGDAHNPLLVTGIEVDGTAVGGNTYHVNYPLGRIVFDEAKSTNSVVTAVHSFRDVQVYRADAAPWFRELQLRSLRVDSSHISQFGSGNWSIGENHDIQLPAIIVEVVARGTSSPRQLGDGSLIMNQDILFHILSESRHQRNNLMDILRYQDDKVIWLFNTHNAATSTGYPLDFRGMVTGYGNMYPDLVAETGIYRGFRWNQCRFQDTQLADVAPIHENLHEAIVRTTAEVYFIPI